jgi:glycine cleavage system H protein
MNVPTNLQYTREHEWLKRIDETTAIVGITDYAQNSLGDITFCELPKVGRKLGSGETFGVVESVKAASDLFMPVDAEVIEVNPLLTTAPETLNTAPYDDAWMLKIKILSPAQLSGLLSPEGYEKHIAG